MLDSVSGDILASAQYCADSRTDLHRKFGLTVAIAPQTWPSEQKNASEDLWPNNIQHKDRGSQSGSRFSLSIRVMGWLWGLCGEASALTKDKHELSVQGECFRHANSLGSLWCDRGVSVDTNQWGQDCNCGHRGTNSWKGRQTKKKKSKSDNSSAILASLPQHPSDMKPHPTCHSAGWKSDVCPG